MYKDGDALAKNYRSEMEANIKEQNEKTIGELKQEWGRDYDNRMEDARAAFKDMGLEEDVAEEVGKLPSGIPLQERLRLYTFLLPVLQ
jgi:hypothetical protein